MIIRYNGIDREVETPGSGMRGLDFIRKYLPSDESEILCMAVDGKHDNLNNDVPVQTRVLDLFTVHDSSGYNTLSNSVIAVMLCAANHRFPDINIAVEHSLGNGFYCEPTGQVEDMPAFIRAVDEEMRRVIAADEPIENRLFTGAGLNKFNHGRFKFARQLGKKYYRISFLCGQVHWFNAPLVPSTGLIRIFQLDAYGKGFVIRVPNKLYPDRIPPLFKTDKIFEVFREAKNRAQLLNIRYVDHLNVLVKENKFVEAIQVYEALHEKKIASIADMIAARKDVKFVFIAGPSSSGKTSFMKRLGIQLRINGISFKSISLDDYFIDRDKLPYDSNGHQDFEHFNALDHELLRLHLFALLNKEKVNLSLYDFPSGKQIRSTEVTELHDNEILILEGIHGLNPDLTGGIDRSKLFKIYISALTGLNYNVYNRVSTSDTRLLRRMIRDEKYRGHSVENTLLRWPSVRAGEEKWIFPYQEEADAIFNSALEYEWSVLRPAVIGKLKKVPLDSHVRPQAQRLINLLELFLPVQSRFIPPTSIIREFLGGSSFIY